MKNKYILSAALVTLFATIAANAQEGFGTNNPDPSSVIDMVSAKRGVLIPRVVLTATNVAAPVTAPANSLMVYNTGTAGTAPNNVVPGFYYWLTNRWVRITNADDIIKGNITSSDLVVTGGTSATFTNVTLAIADDAITTNKIAPGAVETSDIKDRAVTPVKLDGTGFTPGYVATVQANGSVTYAAPSATATNITSDKNLTAGDASVVIGGTGAGAVLQDVNVSVATGGISTVKLADGAVTNVKIGADAVDNSKLADNAVQTENIAANAVETSDIKDKNVTAAKLVADGVTDLGKVATVNSDGSVTYQAPSVTAGNVTGTQNLTAYTNATTDVVPSIEVATGGTNAVLVATSLKVKDGGITTGKLAADAVTSAKILDGTIALADMGTGSVNSTTIVDGSVDTIDLKDKSVTAIKMFAGTVAAGSPTRVPLADVNGNITYGSLPASSVTGANMTAGDASVTIGGAAAGVGSTLVPVSVAVAADGITTDKIATGAVETSDIKDGTIALVDMGTGSVDSSKIVDESITSADIKDGEVKTTDIADKNVTAVKLDAGSVSAATGVRIAQADINGNVTYSNTVPASAIPSGNLTAADATPSIEVASGGTNAVLVATSLRVKDGGITTVKLAADAVTSAKILDGTIALADMGTGSVDSSKIVDESITSADIKDGEVSSADIKDLTITGGDIAGNTITSDKFNSGGAALGTVPTVGTGGVVTYQAPSVTAGNVTNTGNLTLPTGESPATIAITGGNGALLSNATISVADGGITTAKIAADAVTSAKILDGTIALADMGTGSVNSTTIVDGSVAAVDMTGGNTGVANRVPVASATGVVTYQTITPSMIGSAADLTAYTNATTDVVPSIEVASGGTGAVLIATSLKVKDGGITTGKLADGAVTNVKVGADAITTDKIKDGEVKLADLATGSVDSSKIVDGTILPADISSGGNDKVLTTAAGGAVTWIDKSALVNEPWRVQNTTTPASTNVQNIYQQGNVGIGFVSTDAASTSALDVKAGTVKVRALPATAGATTDKIVVADASGVLKTISAISTIGAGDITGGTEITVGNGVDSAFKDVTLGIADNAITNVKMADNAIGSAEIINESILSEDIKDGEVKLADLATGSVDSSKIVDGSVTNVDMTGGNTGVANRVPVASATGVVTYQTITPSMIGSAADLTGADAANNTIEVASGGTGAVLIATSLRVKDESITSAKIKDGTIALADMGTGSVNSTTIVDGSVTNVDMTGGNTGVANRVPVATAAGVVTYQVITPAMIGSVANMTAGDASVTIGGAAAGVGATLVPVSVAVAADGITTDKIATGAVETSDIKDGTIALVDMGTGSVDSSKIVDESITSADIKDGEVKTTDIADKNVTAVKLDAGSVSAATGIRIAQADINGNVTYSNTVPASAIPSGNLTAADATPSIEVASGGTNAVLVATSLRVKDGGITTVKLADGAVTNVKIGADAITTDKIKDGEVKLADLATGSVDSSKIVDESITSADIKDGEVSSADIKDLTITGADIAGQTITANKLDATGSTPGYVATVGTGGVVTYAAPSVTAGNVTGTQNLTAYTNATTDVVASIEVATGGANAVLVATSLKVKDGGITTGKLAADAVTSAKILDGTIALADMGTGSVNSTTIVDGSVDTIDLKDKSVTAIKMFAGTVVAGSPTRVPLADVNGNITYGSLPASSVTGANMTAGDASVTIGGAAAGVGATLVPVSVAVAADGITTDKIATGAVETSDIKDGTIALVDMGTGSVDSSKIVDESITSADIKDGEVKTTDIADKNVTAVKLDAGSVSAATGVRIAQADINGNVTYSNTVPASAIPSGNLTAADATPSIEVASGGTNAVLVATSLRVKDGGITTVKLAADAVTSAKILDGTIALADMGTGSVNSTTIVDGSVTNVDMTGGNTGVANRVPVATAAGVVTYQVITPAMIGSAANMTAGDASVTIGGAAAGVGATLVPVSVAVAADGITTDKIKDGEVKLADLATGSVDSSKIVDGSVDTVDIKNDAVTSIKIADGTIALADMGTGSVDSSKIVDESITSADIKDGEVSSADIKDLTITGADIAGQTITANKLDATGSTPGYVATVGTGGVVTYAAPSVTAGNVTGAQNLTAYTNATTDVVASIEVASGGANAVLVATSLKVKDGGITTGKLAADAVTSAKILDGTIALADMGTGSVNSTTIVDGSVAAVDMTGGNTGIADRVPVADGTGAITYKKITASMIGTGADLTAADGAGASIEVVNGVGATLVASSLRVKDGGISTAKLADGAVTNVKIGADAITTDKIKDGEVSTADIKDGTIAVADIATPGNDKVLTSGSTGTVTWIDKSTLVNEPWRVQASTTPASTNAQNIYQQGNVGIGFTSADAASTSALDVKAGTVKVRDINASYTQATTDKVVIADNAGVLRTTNAAMPKVFYMPPVIFNTSTTGTGLKRNLYLEYVAQFTNQTFVPNTTTGGSITAAANPTFVKSAGATATIPVYAAGSDLMYYVNYFDTTVFANVSIDANGIMTYDIIGSGTDVSFMTITFVVK